MNAQLDIARAHDDYRRSVLTRSYGSRADRWVRLPKLLRTRSTH